MIYVDARELGGAYVWAAKDDDASGTMIKTMARWLGR
jgi:GH18 family chitinase